MGAGAAIGEARCGRVAAGRADGVALRGALAREPAELAVLWLLAPPLLLLALSHLRHQTLYLDRYFLHTIAAQALIVAMLFRGVPRAAGALALAACLFTPPVLYGARTWSQTETMISCGRPSGRSDSWIRRRRAGIRPVGPPGRRTRWTGSAASRSGRSSIRRSSPTPCPITSTHCRTIPTRRWRATSAGSPTRSWQARRSSYVTGLPKHVTIEWVRRFFEARGYETTHVLRDGFWLLALRRTPAGGGGPS